MAAVPTSVWIVATLRRMASRSMSSQALRRLGSDGFVTASGRVGGGLRCSMLPGKAGAHAGQTVQEVRGDQPRIAKLGTGVDAGLRMEVHAQCGRLEGREALGQQRSDDAGEDVAT